MQTDIIFDNYFYVTDKSFTFTLDDDKSRQFGVLFEVTDMLEATGDPEYSQYPFLVSASIVSDKVHKSLSEIEKPNKFSLIYDAYNYMGGVPIDHVLLEEFGDFEEIANRFKVTQAMMVEVEHKFGTYAAQHGEGATSRYLQFKTQKDAELFIDILIKERVKSLSSMIGFILDRPINMAGNTGWDTVIKMVEGK